MKIGVEEIKERRRVAERRRMTNESKFVFEHARRMLLASCEILLNHYS